MIISWSGLNFVHLNAYSNHYVISIGLFRISFQEDHSILDLKRKAAVIPLESHAKELD